MHSKRKFLKKNHRNKKNFRFTFVGVLFSSLISCKAKRKFDRDIRLNVPVHATDIWLTARRRVPAGLFENEKFLVNVADAFRPLLFLLICLKDQKSANIRISPSKKFHRLQSFVDRQRKFAFVFVRFTRHRRNVVRLNFESDPAGHTNNLKIIEDSAFLQTIRTDFRSPVPDCKRLSKNPVFDRPTSLRQFGTDNFYLRVNRERLGKTNCRLLKKWKVSDFLVEPVNFLRTVNSDDIDDATNVGQK